MFMKYSSRRKLVVLHQPSAGAQKDLPLSIQGWFPQSMIFFHRNFLLASNCKTTPLFWYFWDSSAFSFINIILTD